MLLLHRFPACCTEKAAQHAEAYFALSEAVYRLTGRRQLRLVRGERGKPFDADGVLQLSVSHCAGFAACVVSVGGAPVGVDAEPIRAVRGGVAARCFTETEQRMLAASEMPDLAFTRLWTLKESFVKMTGEGLAASLRTVEFSFAADQILAADAATGYTQYLTPDGYVVSVCHAGGTGEVIRTQTAEAWEVYPLSQENTRNSLLLPKI